MNILVTGATSTIGLELLKILCNAKHIQSIFVLTHHTSLDYTHPKIKVIKGSVLDPIDLACDISEIYHFAANTSLRSSADQHTKVSTVNIQGTKNILDLATSLSVKRITYLSSAYAVEPFRNEYEKSKKQAQQLISESSIPSLIFQPSIIASHAPERKNQTIYHYLNTLIHAITLNDGSAIRLSGSNDASLNIISPEKMIHMFSKHYQQTGIVPILSCWNTPCHFITRLASEHAKFSAGFEFTKSFTPANNAEHYANEHTKPFAPYIEKSTLKGDDPTLDFSEETMKTHINEYLSELS